jgi:hypothetical protein
MAFAVDYHHLVGNADLVRVQAEGNVDFGHYSRVARFGNIQHRGAVRRVHVADVSVVAIDHDLAAAGAVEPGNFANSDTMAHAPTFPIWSISSCEARRFRIGCQRSRQADQNSSRLSRNCSCA